MEKINCSRSDLNPVTAYLLKVGAMIAWRKPGRFGIRNKRDFSRTGWSNQRHLILDGANNQSLVLGSIEDFLLMETIKGLSRILSGCAY